VRALPPERVFAAAANSQAISQTEAAVQGRATVLFEVAFRSSRQGRRKMVASADPAICFASALSDMAAVVSFAVAAEMRSATASLVGLA